MRVIFLFILCFFVTSCTSYWDGPYSSSKFSYWPGKNVNELTSTWGRPNRIDTAFNGNWEYMYNAKNVQPRSPMGESRTMAFTGPNNTTYGVNVPSPSAQLPQPITCVAVFQVNPNNIILSVKEMGNGCNGNVIWPGRT